MFQSIFAYIQSNLLVVTISTVAVVGVTGASIATYNFINNGSNNNNPTIVNNNSSSSSSSFSNPKNNSTSTYNSTICLPGQSFVGGRCR